MKLAVCVLVDELVELAPAKASGKLLRHMEDMNRLFFMPYTAPTGDTSAS